MADTNLVVAVRLCDIDEADQPDPLCVPIQDLSTWRHFEILLKSMYKFPPQQIRVKYLDDESDWIEVSSDAELAEAVKICRESGEIMQLQVKAFTQTHICPEKDAAPNRVSLVPNAPYEKVEVMQPLVYPHPQETPVAHPPNPPPRHDCNILVYPHPPEVLDNHNVMAIDSSGNSMSIDGDSGLSMEEKLKILRDQISVCTPPKPQIPQAPVTSLWKEAEKLDREEKIKFMKCMIEKSLDKGKKPQGNIPSVSREEEEYLPFNDVPPPLCVEPGTLGENAPVPKQDPFELESDANVIQLDPNLGAVIMMPKLLTPERVHPVKSKSDVTSEPSPPKAVPEGESSCSTISYRAVTQVKMKAGKKVVGVAPVPMPRNLMMMDGAQSGANAVTVEMPETDLYRSCCVKEEESAASGGASSTSASAETGEVTARGTYGGAAVSRVVKSHSPGSCAVAVVSPETDSQRSSSSEKKALRRETAKIKGSAKGAKSVDKVLEFPSKMLIPYGVGAKPKTVEKRSEGERKKKTDDSVKRRSSASDKKEKEPGSCKREEKKVKVTEDVESGEKALVEDKGAKPLPLQYSDFVKYMKKVKKEMHSTIVKDVTKQTDKLLRKNYSRAVSVDSAGDSNYPGLHKHSNVVHEGIVCDNCNQRDIVGIRYKCGNCSDFDLCDDCENLEGLHDQTHVFLKIRIPQKQAGRLGKTRVPLLRENIYQGDRLLEAKRFLKYQKKAVVVRDLERSDEMVAEETKKQNSIHELPNEGTEVDSEVMLLPLAQGLQLGGLRSEEPEERIVGFEGYPQASVYKLEEFRVQEEKSEMMMVQEQTIRTKTESQDVVVGALVSSPDTEIEDSDPIYAKPEESKEDDAQEEEEVRAQEALEEEKAEEDIEEDGVIQAEVPDVDTDDDYDNLDHSSFAEPCDSDTSDDFCVIDPPSREEYEILTGNMEEDYPEVIPVRNDVDEVEAELSASQPVHSDGESSSSIERLEIPETMSEDDADDESPKEDVTEENDKKNDEAAVLSVNVEDLIHSMSDEEKKRYMELLKAEMSEHQNVEMLSCRAQDLQEVLCQKDNKEEDVEKILRAKEAEAERENQKLEEARRREEKMKREKEELKMREEAERKVREEKKKRKEEEEREEAKKRKEEEEREMEEKVKKIVSEFQMAEEAVPTQAKAVSKVTAGQPERAGRLSRENSASSEVDSMPSDSSEKKDADCQTSPEAQVHASLLIQNVASGVSKAASTAYSTAKDVFYSLQAKQKDWKVPHSTWKPPPSTWTLPAGSWIPPKDTYIPPTSKWTPPPDMYLMPLNEPEEQTEIALVTEEDTQKKETEETSEVDGENVLTEEAVSELTREREAMARLIEMGFANREENRDLLRKHDYDLSQVIQHLLQLEEGDWDWASRRH